jgi:branched-chain amino acid transport system substrate-binding protein
VPLAVAAYERDKQQGAVGVMIYGAPETVALNAKVEQDKIPATAPGFSIAPPAEGDDYPYLFLAAPTYWSQSAAAVEFAKQQLGSSLKGKKIAYIFDDDSTGRAPLPFLQSLQRSEGFTLQTVAVPRPGADVDAQVRAIAQQSHPDFVINHTSGAAPGLIIKGLKQNGYPLDKVLGLVWAGSEADIEAAGGWSAAQGYNTMQFAGVGENYPVIDQIEEMYKAAGKAPPAALKSTIYYNRGILTAALWVAAVKNALTLTHGAKPTGEDIKNGFEMIDDLDRDPRLSGLAPPLAITDDDHEGGGWVQIVQVERDGFKKMTPWIQAYRELRRVRSED